MATAALSLQLPKEPNIDREKGIVRDCILAENGKLAVFKGADGKAKKLLMTPALIASLMALFSADGQTTAHWTHDWIESGRDGLTSKVATFRGFKLNDAGHLVADAHLWPTDKREAILHAAENDPAGMMISTVFDYDGGEKDAIAKRVHAADFVEIGASTTALLAKLSATTNTQKTMTPEDLEKLGAMIDTKITAALAEFKPAAATDDIAALTAAETEAGVADADKKKEDEDKPAALRAALRISRASHRLTLAALSANQSETVKLAEAQFTKALGSGKFDVQAADKGTDLEAALAAYTATGATRGTAIMRLAKDKPAIYNAAKASGKL